MEAARAVELIDVLRRNNAKVTDAALFTLNPAAFFIVIPPLLFQFKNNI